MICFLKTKRPLTQNELKTNENNKLVTVARLPDGISSNKLANH